MFVQLGDAMLNQMPTLGTLFLRVELWLQPFQLAKSLHEQSWVVNQFTVAGS
ncbi:hypothetical protein [Geitlerinema sp. PCC 9228]|uniref:hypothetical protein n=1 Tax=Geitlerinema sp. PCC 9228 TaxID=111611 RepID=UPI00147B3A93|nr:hypothetical protein [Geitlerinema sp. PCC 9228]